MTGRGDLAAEGRAVNGRLLMASSLFGAVVAYLVFVLFLQTPVVSAARLLAVLALFAALSIAHYWASARWLVERVQSARSRRAIVTSLILVALLFPLVYRPPAYPDSPLLRPWSDLAVQFEVPAEAEPLVLAPDGIKLIMGKEVLNTTAFQTVGAWQASPSGLALAPGGTASLRWTGTVPETTTLIVQPAGTDSRLTVYWDDARTTVDIRPGQRAPISVNRKAALPWGFSLGFLTSLAILTAWAAGLAGLVLRKRLASLGPIASGRHIAWAAALLSILLAALTVRLQVDSLGGGLAFLTSTQLVRHAAVLQGGAPDPWQYRLLSEYVAEGMVRLFAFLGDQAAIQVGFLLLRMLQNTAIFLVALALYRKVAASNWLALLGVLILTATMLNAYYDNDLSFNTYFDLFFYLLCVLLLLEHHYIAVVILTLFAALNRETSALIPLLMAGMIYGDSTRQGFRKYIPAVLSLAVFMGVFISLRLAYSPRPLYVPYHHAPGIPLLLYNVTRAFTWQRLLATFGLVPLVGLLFFSSWPPLWQRLFLIVCPAWLLIHSFASIMAETRLFLVPQAIIFIPGAILALRLWLNQTEQAAIPSR